LLNLNFCLQTNCVIVLFVPFKLSVKKDFYRIFLFSAFHAKGKKEFCKHDTIPTKSPPRQLYGHETSNLYDAHKKK